MSQAALDRVEAPWVNFDPIVIGFYCRRCHAREPLRERAIESVITRGAAFLRKHAACMPPPDRYERDQAAIDDRIERDG